MLVFIQHAVCLRFFQGTKGFLHSVLIEQLCWTSARAVCLDILDPLRIKTPFFSSSARNQSHPLTPITRAALGCHFPTTENTPACCFSSHTKKNPNPSVLKNPEVQYWGWCCTRNDLFLSRCRKMNIFFLLETKNSMSLSFFFTYSRNANQMVLWKIRAGSCMFWIEIIWVWAQ